MSTEARVSYELPPTPHAIDLSPPARTEPALVDDLEIEDGPIALPDDALVELAPPFEATPIAVEPAEDEPSSSIDLTPMDDEPPTPSLDLSSAVLGSEAWVNAIGEADEPIPLPGSTPAELDEVEAEVEGEPEPVARPLCTNLAALRFEPRPSSSDITFDVPRTPPPKVEATASVDLEPGLVLVPPEQRAAPAARPAPARPAANPSHGIVPTAPQTYSAPAQRAPTPPRPAAEPRMLPETPSRPLPVVDRSRAPRGKTPPPIGAPSVTAVDAPPTRTPRPRAPSPVPRAVLGHRQIQERRTSDLSVEPGQAASPRASSTQQRKADTFFQEALKAMAARDYAAADRHLAVALTFSPGDPRLITARGKVKRILSL